MKIRINKLIVKHHTERNILKTKLELELGMLHKQRKFGLDNLTQKYKNKKVFCCYEPTAKMVPFHNDCILDT